MIEKYPRATAYHEAGHAVVAWSLGLQVGTIHVKKEDAGGGADIESADHLSLVDQIAVCAAGYAAECTFGVENHDLASFTDQVKIADILEAHGVSEEEQGPALRDKGHNRACDLLKMHQSRVTRLVERLVECGIVDASEFQCLMRRGCS